MFVLRRTLKPPSTSATIRRLLTTVNLPDRPKSAAYDDLITKAGRERDFAAVNRLINQGFAHGCTVTKNTFNFISSDLSGLDDLLQTLSRLNNGSCRKNAFDSLIARLCRMQLTGAALRVVDEMIRAKYGADAVTFHPIVGVGAWRVIEIMRENGIARDVHCYNMMLRSYSVAGDWTSCVGVLRKMAEEGLAADAITCDVLVMGACRMGKVDGAMTIIKRMLEDGMKVMYSSYAHVILGLTRLGYCERAVEFVKSHGGRQKELDKHNFELLATRLIDMKKVTLAKHVFEDMVKRDLPLSDKLKKDYHKKLCVE